LTGWTAMAGVPGAIYVLGQAGGALVWGFSFEKIGRRWGLALGQMIGVIGSAIAITAVVGRFFLFFLTGLVMVGMARSAVDLGRFIAAEVHQPEMRERAISKVVLGSTVGAIVEPLRVGATGKLATMAGLPELCGPYGVGFVVLVLSSILILSGLRPEPRDIGRELSRVHTESVPALETRSLSEIILSIHPGRNPGRLCLRDISHAKRLTMSGCYNFSQHIRFLKT
jgi:MFS family permease